MSSQSLAHSVAQSMALARSVAGVEKLLWFCFAYQPSLPAGGYSLIRGGSATPAANAYATSAALLEGVTPAASRTQFSQGDCVDDAVWAWRFTYEHLFTLRSPIAAGATSITVAFATNGTECTASVRAAGGASATLVVRNAFGRVVKRDRGAVTLVVGDAPVYVVELAQGEHT